MAKSPHLNLPFLVAAQSQKHVTVNQSLEILDSLSQLSVISSTLSTPPADPENGDRYIITSPASGDWQGHEDKIAAWLDNAWMFFLPGKGWKSWEEQTGKTLVWSGTSWELEPNSASEINHLNQLGVNDQANATNRLSVKSPSALFTGESDDIRVNLSKENEDDTASLVFQSGFSGRAEIGLTGDNQLHFKVSSDGSNWVEALILDNSSAECHFQQPLSLPQFSKSNLPATTPAARLIYVHDATGGGVPACSDGSSWKRISDNTVVN